MKKRFKLILRESYTRSQMIGLAKAMSKTDARIVKWDEGVEEDPYIIFEIKEPYPIFKPQIESYGIIVNEIKK